LVQRIDAFTQFWRAVGAHMWLRARRKIPSHN